jgi:hypothetical protein
MARSARSARRVGPSHTVPPLPFLPLPQDGLPVRHFCSSVPSGTTEAFANSSRLNAEIRRWTTSRELHFHRELLPSLSGLRQEREGDGLEAYPTTGLNNLPQSSQSSPIRGFFESHELIYTLPRPTWFVRSGLTPMWHCNQQAAVSFITRLRPFFVFGGCPDGCSQSIFDANVDATAAKSTGPLPIGVNIRSVMSIRSLIGTRRSRRSIATTTRRCWTIGPTPASCGTMSASANASILASDPSHS